MNTKRAFAGVGLLAITTAFGQPLRTATIVTEPIPRGKIHLQGFDCDENAIYWGFGQEVVKTDWNGKILAEGVSRFEPDQGFEKQVLKGHIGDLCVVNGKVYATSWYLHCVARTVGRAQFRMWDGKAFSGVP